MDIEPYRLDKEIIRQTMQRIVHDFAFFNITLFYSGNEEHAYAEISAQLNQVIDNIAVNNTSLLMQIIYKIDISEQQLQKCMELNPDKTFTESVAHLIIEREMQKVITRKIFTP